MQTLSDLRADALEVVRAINWRFLLMGFFQAALCAAFAVTCGGIIVVIAALLDNA